MLLQRALEQRDALIGLAAAAQRLRLEPDQAQIVGMIVERRLRGFDCRRVLLRGEVRFHEVAGQVRIAGRLAARLLERRDCLVVVADLLVRKAEMRQQHTRVESGRRCGHDRRQRIDDGLILPALFERLGQRVVTPRRFAVLLDQTPRRVFRAFRVAQLPLRLRHEIQRLRVVRPRRQRVAEQIARFREVVAPARLQQRRRVAHLQLDAARRLLHQILVRVGRVVPAAFVLVGVDEQHRAVLPARFLTDEIVQQRNRFPVLIGAQVEPRKRRAHVRIRFARRAFDGQLEVTDRLGDVLVARGRRRTPPRSGVAAPAAVDHGGVHDPEDAVGFAVRRRDLQCELGGRARVVHAVLAQVQRSKLRRDIGGLRIELHRFLVCRDRSRCIVALVEMMREQELRVRFSNLVGRRVDDGSVLQSEGRQKECDLHTFEL